MVRYVTTAAIAILALLAAFLMRSRSGEAFDGTPDEVTVLDDRPAVEVTRVAEGRRIAVAYRYAGSVSRASLVYELDGKHQVADRSDDCAKALADQPGLRGGEYVTEVTLDGVVPENASNLRVVLEDETGTKVVPVLLP